MNRRRFLTAATSGAVFFNSDAVDRARAASTDRRPPEAAAQDEDYWREIQQAFTVDRNLVNFNNGGVCPSPRIVQEAMRRYLEFSNMLPAYNMWRILDPQVESVRTRLAGLLGVDREEVAITRNASEALEIAQLGLDLKNGDEVLITDQDYPRMLTTWEQCQRRNGISVRRLPFKVPVKSEDDLVRTFEQAITPKTRVIHFCHVTNLSGQIFPVKKICQMARSRGIETIVDGAHTFAHFPAKYDELQCDYYGTSLHKWLLAPHGTGMLFVRREKIAKLWPMFAASPSQDNDIRKFEQIGTHPSANFLAIGEAITFHQTIGPERKFARLRYLRQLWTSRLISRPGLGLGTLTPPEAGGLGLLTLDGRDPAKFGDKLLTEHQFLTVPIIREDYRGLRITPNIYTTLDEIDRFCSAVEKLAKA
ncbi:MAG: aminotransferase class V-fold PLP-dependent enzyme [Bryobacteraceae bacterium]